ncbi:succinate dehydrogenase assembly factor 2, mitochondrial-like [Limulus polyphemus]|uniref:Succinate dehydrogenase assembly factor 2, mitochondrial n=1 Tax=Limulus polyphemus TaxID=6850 RepID=A0ABM1BWW6_LIMPO|nr:succinate dehydrogenase assembly factor 2, mitochondrial-like [Limulus polyphemus]XP_022258182.1 succinate dehydrogenase assembly factor 2, mitochondrial-like [Limulus polyphemus]
MWKSIQGVYGAFHFQLSKACLNSSTFRSRWLISRISPFSTNESQPPQYGHGFPIPSFTVRQDEPLPLKRARLLYQSRKRGMLENGLILSTFAAKHLNSFDEQQLEQYDKLINLPSNDWDIYYWATEVKETPPEFKNEVMDLLKQHVKNDDREGRCKQPDLT